MAKPFRATFGGIALLVTSFEEDGGRDWATQSPSRGDVHTLQDRGRKLKSTPTEIMFVDQPGMAPYLDRFRQFQAMADNGTVGVFTHPLDGSYLAIASEFHYSVDAESRSVSVACTFLQMQVPVAVQEVGAGVSPAAGPEEVGVQAAKATRALARTGIVSTVPAQSLDKVSAWASAEDLDSRLVFLEASSLASQIDAVLDALDVGSGYEKWESFKALQLLRYKVTRAADAVTADSARSFEYTVRVAVPLRVLCAQIYGASSAEVRSAEVAKLNHVRTPGRLAAGTVLRMPEIGATR